MTLSDLGGHQQACRSQQLQLLPADIADAQESVHEVDSQREDLLLNTLLIAQLQHPDGDQLPHEGLDVRLDCGKVITMRNCGLLQQQHVVHYPRILGQKRIWLCPVHVRLRITATAAVGASGAVVRHDVLIA